MNPLVLRGDFLLVDKHDRSFNREDVVLVRNPRFPQQFLLERVVGVPKDTVGLEKDRLILNGKWKPERYSTTSFEGMASSTYVTPDAYYMLNDNRSNELDSRVFGPVLNDQIVGKAFFLLRGPHFEWLP
jgi:signal peptidase I